jgi:hypothetical protein
MDVSTFAGNANNSLRDRNVIVGIPMLVGNVPAARITMRKKFIIIRSFRYLKMNIENL